MNNTVIYARYNNSTGSEHSIEEQLQECIKHAEKEGLTIIGVYIDRGSADASKQPEFQRMIADSNKKNFDVILVCHFDRFSRNRYDSAHYKNILKNNGVRVISARENISEDAGNILMESILEGYAEYYRIEHSKKIKRGLALKKEREAKALE